MKNIHTLPGIILTGVQSGLWYLKTIHEIAQNLNGKTYVFPMKILQLPFEEINAILPYKLNEASKMLAPYFEEMKTIKAQPFILANITLHEVFNFYEPDFYKEIKLLSIDEILLRKLPVSPKKLAILGTTYTMNSGYFQSLIPKNHEVFSLDKKLQEKVDDLRLSFNYNTDCKQAHLVFNELLNTHPEVDLFIISCTELALALECFENKTRFFNLPQLQCEMLIAKHLKT